MRRGFFKIRTQHQPLVGAYPPGSSAEIGGQNDCTIVCPAPVVLERGPDGGRLLHADAVEREPRLQRL